MDAVRQCSQSLEAGEVQGGRETPVKANGKQFNVDSSTKLECRVWRERRSVECGCCTAAHG